VNTVVDKLALLGRFPRSPMWRAYEDRMVQSEPWIERDRAMIDPLKSLGIEKGKLFQPDDKTADILKSAAQEALARFDVLYETIYEPLSRFG
jgi:hypothetical protein